MVLLGVSEAPVAMEHVYPSLCFGMLVAFICQFTSNTSADEQPISSDRVGNLSRYHDQVMFINNFLLSAGFINEDSNMTIKQNNSAADINLIVKKISENLNNNVTIPKKDNNTDSNELQLMSVPAVLSSVIDLLPVHPRIPRRSPSQRRRTRPRKHRHSSRVYKGQPSRFLLPPFENQYLQSFTSTFPPEIMNISSTTLIQSTTEVVTEGFQAGNKVDEKESLQNTTTLQYRKVFIPPPLRYLLPPFFYENYINAQPSSTQTPIQETSPTSYPSFVNDYYNTNDLSTSNVLYQTNVSSLAPIIIIETVSEDDVGQGSWNQQSDLNIQYTTMVSVDYSIPKKESELVNIPSTDTYSSQSTTETPHSDLSFAFTPQFGTYKIKPTEYSSGDQKRDFFNQRKYSTDVNLADDKLSITSNSQLKSSYEEFALTSTSLPLISSPTTIFPILRGPNVEQTLFETGNFHIFDAAMNESDKTVHMMNKPLLSQEVAEAGMKITANMKEEMVKNKKINRGKFKYRHLNQFNFENTDTSKGSTAPKSSQLLVAETSYYNDRRKDYARPLTQETETHIIPGIPGRDYPTLTKPQSGSHFSCRSVKYHRGYVADVSTGCQVFYICVGNGPGEPMLCPNGTIFSQDFLVCDWWYNVDCQSQT